MNILDTISHLQSYGNRMSWEKQQETADWLERELKSLGLDVTRHFYEFENKKWANIIATIKGTRNPKEIVMFITHFDSINYDPSGSAPGADDNGSGVAVLIESSRMLARRNPDRTLMFCFFSNEERKRPGSKAFAQQAREKQMDIKAVVNIDMIGYKRQQHAVNWDVIKAQATFKRKIKLLFKMVRSYTKGVLSADGDLKVVGQEANRELVAATAKAFRSGSGLRIKEFVLKDCG